MRPPLVLIATAVLALGISACGSEGLSVSEDDPQYAGAVLFAERCSGCHTLNAAGSQGSGNRALRAQGPNFDEREISTEDAIYAIQNGGFSGAIMPQNIVVGPDAEAVAGFLAEYSGSEVEDPPRPADSAGPSEDEPVGGPQGDAPEGEGGEPSAGDEARGEGPEPDQPADPAPVPENAEQG